MAENNNEIAKKKSVPIWAIVAGVVAIIAVIGVAIAILAQGSPAKKYKEKIELAEKYLEEMQYEQAIAAYEEAIAIDPKNVTAYIELADVYLEMADNSIDDGDDDLAREYIEEAIDVLEDGIDNVGKKDAKKLKAKIEEIEDEYSEYLDLEDDKKSDKTASLGIDDSDKSYEAVMERIDEYKRLLDEDPYNVDAYIGIINAYIDINDFDNALLWAEKGYEMTGDDAIKQLLDMLNGGNVIDSEGRTKRQSFYSAEGQLLAMFEYTYLKGNCVDVMYRLDANGVIQYELKYEYDDKGRITKGCNRHFGDGSGIYVSYYTYDSNGTTTCQEDYYESGDFCGKVEYEYDEEGWLLKEINYNSEYELGSYNIYEYDGNDTTTEYRYDGDGELLGYRVSTSSDGEYRNEYYDADGNLDFYDVTEVIDGKTIWTSYDSEGNITMYTESN